MFSCLSRQQCMNRFFPLSVKSQCRVVARFRVQLGPKMFLREGCLRGFVKQAVEPLSVIHGDSAKKSNSWTMEEQQKKYAQLYQSIAETPAVVSAHFPGSCWPNEGSFSPASVVIQTSQRDILNKKKVSALHQFYAHGTGQYARAGFPSEVNDSAAITLSPSRKLLACVKTLDPADKTKTAIQVWSSEKLLYSIPTTLAKHGPVYTDAQMGGLAWSPDEKFIAYIAEQKLPENETYFAPETEANQKSTRGKEFEFVSDWGELYTGKKKAEIFVVDLANTSIKKIEIPDTMTPGQLIWNKDGSHLIHTGWDIPEGIKLGFVYCFNRESKIYSTPVNAEDGKTVCLNESEPRSRSPRLSPDGKFIFFLATRNVITHNTCNRLLKLDLESKKITVVVDAVENPTGDEFPGIYTDLLPSPLRCWSADHEHLYIDSVWRSNFAILSVNINTGKVQKLLSEIDRQTASTEFLDHADGFLLYSLSTPVEPSSVYCLDTKTNKSTLVYKTPAPKEVAPFKWRIHSIKPKDKEEHVYEATVIHHGAPQNSPFVIFPHGGPHSNSTILFSPTYCYLVALGYVVVLVNYRGSTGFGIEPLESLLGKAGNQDVHDVQQAAEEMIQHYDLDRNNAFVMGGSHGGFLTCHLIGQFPEFYRAAVAHNPVTDFQSAVRTSDIPDWVYAESLACPPKKIPSPEDLAVMFQKSPMYHVDKVKTPLLLKVGQLDQRCHPTQAFSYYRSLVNLGVPTKLYLYPSDSHPIDSVNPESDSFVNIASWFQTYRK